MGCFDMYCKVCSGPFVSYKGWDLPNMEGINTDWLTNAMIHYHETGEEVEVVYYDGYGRFEDAKGVEYDVVELQHNNKVSVTHKLCKGRKMSDNNLQTMKNYGQYEQFFNIDKIIQDGNQGLLHTPSS